MRVNKIFTGAFVIAVGSFLTKVLGALYRVPLTEYLGAKGLGIYQMAFPAYAALLDVSSSGVPGAMAKLIAENEEAKGLYLKNSLKLFGIIGGVSALILFLIARPLAIFQGNAEAFYTYKILSPAVFLVALIACFRGYFQGQFKMYPTAISQFIEQVIKLVLGIILMKSFSSLFKRVSSAVTAVVVGEVIALIFLIIVYIVNRLRYPDNTVAFKLLDGGVFSKNENFLSVAKRILKPAVPIMLLSIIFPLSQIVESSFIIRLLNAKSLDGVKIYGIFSGTALTVINLPVSICYGLSAVAVPAVSAKLKVGTGKISTEKLLILLTLILSVLGAVCCIIFSPFAVKILFPSLKEYAPLTVNLIRALSLSVVFMSMLQTTNSILIGKGKTYQAVVNCFIGVLVKIVLTGLLVRIESISIFGAVIANTLCYLLAVFLNLVYIKKRADKKDKDRKYRNR